MALDLELLSGFAANILFQSLEYSQGGKTMPFWTDAGRARVNALVLTIGVTVSASDSIDAIKTAVKAKLSDDQILRKSLEQEFGVCRFIAHLAKLLTGDPAKFHAKEAAKNPVVMNLADFGRSVQGDPQPVLELVLYLNQDDATTVALAFEEAIPYPWMAHRELNAILESRVLRNVEPVNARNSADADLVGLAFSGGGIRSATFNLGILQALAELKLLRYVDYLSTVSGGGYIGSWLHRWIDCAGSEEKVRSSLSPKDSPDPESFSTQPIKWLRRYSNYLAPRLGLLSTDTWGIFTIWARNTLLNIVIIIAALAALLLAPRGLWVVFDPAYAESWGRYLLYIPLGFSVWIIRENLYSFEGGREDKLRFQEKSIHLLVALPVLLSSLLLTASMRHANMSLDLGTSGVFFTLLCYLSFAGGYYPHFYEGGLRPHSSIVRGILFVASTLLFNAIAAVVGGLLLMASGMFLSTWKADDWARLVLGPVCVVLIYSLVIILHLGLFGRNLPEARREWWSRLGAVVAVWLVGWISITTLSVYGNAFVEWLIGFARGLVAMGAAAGWVGTTLAGVLKGQSAETGPKTNAPKSDFIARIAPPVFILGLMLLLTLGIHVVSLQVFVNEFPKSSPEALMIWGGAAVLLAVALALSYRVDVNEFSMHNFYENRLVRAYLGAPRATRKPNRFTGFDPDDDIPIAQLVPDKAYTGPYAIVNTALNLVKGEELAWQERKAESFVFTPLFSGFAATPTDESTRARPDKHLCLHGYRPTTDYGFPGGGIRLGRALAISGAAASPNMGYHTSPATAFLMTTFNVRLGWWIGNPRRRDGWQLSGPLIGLMNLLNELAAAANNRSKYVYLSDGGHFENLGIYELVRRECRYIVACDGGADPNFTFEDLGGAIRKCRADFGVEIEIDLNSIRPRVSATESRPVSTAHCAVGTIKYPDGVRGTLLYLKTSLTADEPSDVLEFATLHPEFPHTPTSDQFFDESHFESYRRLGYHAGIAVFEQTVRRRVREAPGYAVDADREGFFTDLRQRWYAASSNVAKSFSRHGEELAKVMDRLRNDATLTFLDNQISPDWERLAKGASGPPPSYGPGLPPTYEERRAGFHFCNSLIQLMENVYVDLNLEEEGDHPDNSGWLNLFSQWSGSTMFRTTWLISSSSYGSRFRRFCEYRLGLEPTMIGRITVRPSLGPDDPRLTPRERSLLATANIDWAKHNVQLLEIHVIRPESGEVMAELGIGLSVLSAENQMAYFRIHEHLRDMDLDLRVLEVMVSSIKPEPAWHALPKNFAELPTQSELRRLERMLESAFLRKDGASGQARSQKV